MAGAVGRLALVGAFRALGSSLVGLSLAGSVSGLDDGALAEVLGACLCSVGGSGGFSPGVGFGSMFGNDGLSARTTATADGRLFMNIDDDRGDGVVHFEALDLSDTQVLGGSCLVS